MLQYAGKAYRRIIRRVGSIGRVAERTKEKRIWTRHRVGNQRSSGTSGSLNDL
jgi:hypothetical protein